MIRSNQGPWMPGQVRFRPGPGNHYRGQSWLVYVVFHCIINMRYLIRHCIRLRTTSRDFILTDLIFFEYAKEKFFLPMKPTCWINLGFLKLKKINWKRNPKRGSTTTQGIFWKINMSSTRISSSGSLKPVLQFLLTFFVNICVNILC